MLQYSASSSALGSSPQPAFGGRHPFPLGVGGQNIVTSGSGTYEMYGLSGIGSAFKVKSDIGPPFAEVRV